MDVFGGIRQDVLNDPLIDMLIIKGLALTSQAHTVACVCLDCWRDASLGEEEGWYFIFV